MSHNQGEGSVPKGNEWEVVTLTESTYAASPSPVKDGASESNVVGAENPETAQAMFMSGHFGSPSEQEKLPQEAVPSPKAEQTDELVSKNDDDNDINIERLISGEFSGEKKIAEKADDISFYTSDFSEAKGGRSLMDEPAINEPIESMDCSDDSEISDTPKHVEEDDFDDFSHEKWWRKHALSLYEQAKNVSPVWSIVVAAAVVGLVIVGYRWQRDKQQVIQLKPRLVVDDEGSRWIMGPATRVKSLTALGAQSSPQIRVFSAAEH